MGTSGDANLGRISTHWSAVHNPHRFVMRYAPAIRNYLSFLLRDPHDTEDVLQDFLLWVTRHGFTNADPARGRFRDYLFITIRNRAFKHLEKQKKQAVREKRHYQESPTAAATRRQDAKTWLAEWQQCVLTRALDALERHQRRAHNNLYYTVLRLKLDQPHADSASLAGEVSRATGKEFRPETYRQQLRRARQMFARLLLEEVARTLEKPTTDQIEAELIEVGLMPYVRPFLAR